MWWSDLNLANRTWSFLFFTLFSFSSEYFEYTSLVRLCDDGGSTKHRFTSAHALLYETGLPAPERYAASFACASASSLPGMSEWPGNHWMVIDALHSSMAFSSAFTSGLLFWRAEQRDWLSVAITHCC